MIHSDLSRIWRVDQIIQDFGNIKALGLKKPVKQVQSRLGMAKQMWKPFGIFSSPNNSKNSNYVYS